MKKTNLILDVNSSLVVDVSFCKLDSRTEKVEVLSSALHVETANTQMGEVIEGKEMDRCPPLVTRSYTGLAGITAGCCFILFRHEWGARAVPLLVSRFLSATRPISGSENAGALSVNGMREAANGFILNGILVQETGFSGAGAIPNLDSIAEFRILTNKL